MGLLLNKILATAQEETSHGDALTSFSREFGDFTGCKMTMIQERPHTPSSLSSLILSAKMPEPA